MVASWLAVEPSASRGQSAELLKQRFLDDAPRQWEEYRSLAHRFHGTVTILSTQGEEVRDHYVCEYKHNPECTLFVGQSLGGHRLNGEVFAYNPLYAFSLHRKGKDEPWMLNKYQERGGERPPPISQQTLQKLTPLRSLIRAYNEDLSDLVRQPTFRVLKVATVATDNLELLQVDFDNTHPLTRDDRLFFPIQSGTLIVAPGKCWCVIRCDLRTKHIGTEDSVSVEHSIRDPNERYLIPQGSVIKTDSVHETKGRRFFKTEMSFELSTPVRLPPDKDFTLSAFGLPEPAGVTWEKPTPNYLWLLAAAAAFAALTFGFRYLARRRQVAA